MKQQEPQCSARPNVCEKCVAALTIATGAIFLIAGIVLLAVLLSKENNPPKVGHLVAMSIIAGGGGIGYGIKGWRDKKTWNSTLGKILKVAIPLLWVLPFMFYLLSCVFNEN